MANLVMWAFITEIVYGFLWTLFIVLSLEPFLLYNYGLTIITLGIVMNLIRLDAKSKNLNIAHALWSFLGLIGVVVYYFGFAQKAKKA